MRRGINHWPACSDWFQAREENRTPATPELSRSFRLTKRASDAPYHTPTVSEARVLAKSCLANTRASAEEDRTFLPHLDRAYNLARVLMRNAEDAEDVVQEVYLRALRGFFSFRGEASLPSLLTIVRNKSLTWLRKNRSRVHAEFQEELYFEAACGSRSPVDVLRTVGRRGALHRTDLIRFQGVLRAHEMEE
jgi:RNA polymerase sigma factor (sigma-70 family)